jgi:serine protease Do
VYGIHEDTDLALLKIEADSLPAVHWSQGTPLQIGNWLASVVKQDEPPSVGVVGVTERLIRPKSGFMGVNLAQEEARVVISAVTPDTPAMKSGLRPGDVIREVNGQVFTERAALIEKVQTFAPGDEITLKIIRDEKERVVDIVLGDAEELNPQFDRSNQQNTMGGNELSQRRRDFPLAVQHDTVLSPNECGGPVVNLTGEVVGINIARDGRVSSLMLPAALVVPIIEELKSGQYAPAVVNGEAIEDINRALKRLRTTLNQAPGDNEGASKELATLREKETAAEKNLDEALKELDSAREARLRAEIALQTETQEIASAKEEIERLERELRQLVSGTR